MKKIMVLFIGLSLVLGLWAYTKANGEEITVCVRSNGLMHVIGEGFRRTECRRNETLLSWDMHGEKGDTGEQGEQGEKGDKGDDGEDGEDGIEFHLFDDDGQDLGLLIRTSNLARDFTVYIPQVDGFLNIEQSASSAGIVLSTNIQINFAGAGCTGQQFFVGSFPSAGTQVLYYNIVTEKWYQKNPSDNFQARSSLSRLDFHAGCVGDIANHGQTLLLEEVSLPLTEPFAIPLEVKSL